jgi:hypothetical protein
MGAVHEHPHAFLRAYVDDSLNIYWSENISNRSCRETWNKDFMLSTRFA